MREIKFRAWDGKKMYIDIYSILLQNGKVTQIMDTEAEDVTDVVVEQYTGLKDKNGKEVYEGDCLKIWMGGDKQKNPYIVDDMRVLYADIRESDGYMRITDFEVIGNIHERRSIKDVTS